MNIKLSHIGTVNLLTAMGGMDMCTSHAKLLFFSTIITSVYLFSFSKLVMEVEIFHFDDLPSFSGCWSPLMNRALVSHLLSTRNFEK